MKLALIAVMLLAGGAAPVLGGEDEDWLSGLRHRYRLSAGRYSLSSSSGDQSFFPEDATAIKGSYAFYRPRAAEALATAWYLNGDGQDLVCGTAEFRLRWNQGFVVGGYFALGFGYGRNLTNHGGRALSTTALGFESNTLFIEFRSLADSRGIMGSTVLGIRF